MCNNTKDNLLWEPVKLNFKFHRNCVNTGKIGKFLCVRFHFVKFEISQAPIKNCLCGYYR